MKVDKVLKLKTGHIEPIAVRPCCGPCYAVFYNLLLFYYKTLLNIGFVSSIRAIQCHLSA